MSSAADILKTQLDILKRSDRSGTPLAELLAGSGLSYDDLIYERSRRKTWNGREPVVLDDVRIEAHGVPMVSFFTGSGGMDLGLEAAGFQHVAAFEINDLFCSTLRQNRPNWNIFGPPTHNGDVSKFDEVAEALSPLIRTPFDGLFVGGPPCQPFSIAANQRFSKWGDNFKRTGFLHENGGLLFDFLRLIVEFRPAAFVIENVPGLRDLDGGVQLKAAVDELRENGYRVAEPFVLNAADYSVPQERLRLFVVGSRRRGPFKAPPSTPEHVGAGSVLSGRAPALPNNETREHRAESVRRYMALYYGQRDQLGRVDRLDPTLASKTVIAGGTRGGGRSHLHPEIPRTLSVRECALLQTFPDDYVFAGAPARQFTQVGNAVPPVLAAQMGNAVKESYF
jgi:DNA (cytosine-5)-methyltransferase 1